MPDTFSSLQAATKDLLFPGESDFPIVPVEWPADAAAPVDAATLLAAKGYPADTLVETLEFPAFLAPKTEQRDDQDDAQRATAKRLQELVEVLQSHLSEIRVYKVGSIHFDLFILGHDAQGRWFGVSTQVVET